MSSVTPGAPVGVVGAGTMGTGIAEVASRAGHPVRLLDAAPGAGAAAIEGLAGRLARDVEKGRLDQAEADGVARRVAVVDDVAALAGCSVVIEAVAERLDVKQQLFSALEDVLDPSVLLATNTSSLSVTAVAAPLRHPERVVGLHFFNPAPRMRLVEVVRGEDTAPDVVEAATDLARAWGKTPVQCTSTPGFIVNRVARPFYGEAQRMVEEGVADPATIDLVLRECGGFPMGPFELTDLVGQDVNLAVSRSVWEQTFGDPRYAPTVFQQRLVDAGRLGRKTGRGVFDYRDGAAGARPPVASESKRPAPHRVHRASGDGWGFMEPLVDRARAGGIEILDLDDADDSVIVGAIHLPGEGMLLPTGARSINYVGGFSPVAESGDVTGVIALDWVRDAATCTRVALAPSLGCSAQALDAAIGFCQAAGMDVTVVGDGAGMIVARTVAMIVNEAAELLARREANAHDIDRAMTLGTGYPVGPLTWGDHIGPDTVHDLISDLQVDNDSGRYRPSRLLADAHSGSRSLLDLGEQHGERSA